MSTELRLMARRADALRRLGVFAPPAPRSAEPDETSDVADGDEPPPRKKKRPEDSDDDENGDDENAEAGDDGETDDEDDEPRKKSRLIARRIVALGARMRAEPAPTFVRLRQPTREIPRRPAPTADQQSAALAILNMARRARGEVELTKLPRGYVGGR